MRTLPIPRLRANSIPHEDAEAVQKFVAFWRPLEVSTDDARGYRHPWQVAMHWNTDAKRWEAQFFRNSYLGGPMAREVEGPEMAWKDLPRATRRRYEEKDPGTPVRPWLSEEPMIALGETRWRRLGKDAGPTLQGTGETIPEPLLDLGAATGDEIRIDREELTFTISQNGSPVDRAKVRLVRAVDLVLNVARQRVRLEADDRGEIGVTLDLPAEESPWVTVSRARFTPASQAEGTLEQFAAAIDDTGVDQMLAARVYLLSRPGAQDGAPLDGTWVPYVDQGLFWNPQHRTNREINIVEPLRLRFQTGLALGAGDAMIQGALADLNTRDALASLLISKARVVGRYFT